MSYQVIARKHRPQSFREVVGQQHVTRTLANAITQNRVAHAYIFSGARGVGKTTTARILAKALNCVIGPAVEPCNACDSCREIATGTSLDVMEIDAASNRGIDQIRELRETVRYAPAASRYKVVILDEAHQLTDEASNALLKTLEEPPDKVVFVMATTRPEDLNDTIRSRAQHFHFRALSFDEILTALEEMARKESLEIEPAALAVLARAAEGSLRDALSVLEQAVAYCGTKINAAQVRDLLGVVAEEALEELVAAVAARSAERVLALLHQRIAEGHNLQHFCREAIRHFRNLLVARVCGPDSTLLTATPEERPRLAAAAAQFSEEDLTRYFQILLVAENDLRHKPDPRVHMELGLLRLVNAARLAPLEEVLAEISGGRTASTGVAARASAAPQGGGAAMKPPEGTVRAAAPAPISSGPAQAGGVAGPQRLVTQALGEVDGLGAAQVEEIKSAIREQQKFLWSLVEHVSRWELDGGEMRLYFPTQSRALAEMLQARDPLEKLRSITSRVMGQPLRVCVRLDAVRGPEAGGAAARPAADARAALEQDPIVRAMLKRFGGEIREVKRPGEEE